MGLFRVHSSRNFTIINNTVFHDAGLSWKAKGLLVQMLSLPEEWDYTEAGLAKLAKDGLTSTRSALKDLENARYLKRSYIRDTNGRVLDISYDIYETPIEPDPAEEHEGGSADRAGRDAGTVPESKIKPSFRETEINGETKFAGIRTGEHSAGGHQASGNQSYSVPNAGNPQEDCPQMGGPNTGNPQEGCPKMGEPNTGNPQEDYPQMGTFKKGRHMADNSRTPYQEKPVKVPKSRINKGKFESKKPDAGEPLLENPIAGEPLLGFPILENPISGFRTQLRTNIIKNEMNQESSSSANAGDPYQGACPVRKDDDDCKQTSAYPEDSIKERIGYKALREEFDGKTADSLYDTVRSILNGTRQTVRVAGKKVSADSMKALCRSLTKEDAFAIAEVLYDNSQVVTNRNGYIKALILNGVDRGDGRDSSARHVTGGEGEGKKERASPAQRNAFNDFIQRNYDYGFLEKALVGAGTKGSTGG